MKWFKHMAHMSEDVKIKRVIKAFGVEGYGLYNYVIELIVRKLETDSPLPELEETAQDLAYDLKMDTIRVEEIIRFCIDQGLFEQGEVDGKLMARKVYKFLDASTTRSAEMKAMIANFNQLSRTVPDNPRLSVPEENRIEQNRREESREEQEKTPTKKQTRERPTDTYTFTNNLDIEISVPVNLTTHTKLVEKYGKGTVETYYARIRHFCDQNGKRYKDYAATAVNWMDRDGVKPPEKPKFAIHDDPLTQELRRRAAGQ